MMKIAGLIIAVLWIVLMGEGITTSPSQQVTPLPPGIALQATMDGHSTQIAALSTEIYVERQINRDQSTLNAAMWGTLDSFSISTEVATLVGTPLPTATARPSSTPSATMTQTPRATNTPQGTAPTPTPEGDNGLTATALTNVPTFPTNTPVMSLTPSPTFTATTDPAWINGCVPDGDFEPHEGFRINTRAKPSLNAERLDLVTASDILIICSESLRVVDGYTWLQIVSTEREEWLVIRQGGETWGVLTVWPE